MPPTAERYAKVLDSLEEVVFQTEVEGRWTYLNEAWTRMLGYAVAESIGQPFLDLVHPDELNATVDRFAEVLEGDEGRCVHETRYRRADGSYRWIEVRASMLYDRDGSYVGNVGTLIDIDERRRIRELLDLETAVLRSISDREGLARTLRSIAGFVRDRLDAGVTIEPAPPTPPLPPRRHAVPHPQTSAAPRPVVAAAAGDDDAAVDHLTLGIRSTAGAPLGTMRIHLPAHDRRFRNHSEEIERARTLAAIAIERSQTLENEWRLALHDLATGLPNRSLFLARVSEALAGRRGRDGITVLMEVGLDDLRAATATAGEEAAARILTTIAERLDSSVLEPDVLGRVSDGEFALFLTEVVDEADALARARTLLTALREPIDQDDGDDVSVTPDVSLGLVAVDPVGPPSDAGRLLLQAHAARQRAHESGLGVATFDERTDRPRLHAIDLSARLRTAIRRGELELHYQPRVQVSDGSLLGIEALVRWRHPGRGLVQPGEFIPTAERAGVIRDLTFWVLQRAIEDRGRLPHVNGSVSVNLSPRLLHDPDLTARVEEVIDGGLLGTTALEFELTEHAVMLDPPRAARSMRQLSDLGVRFSIDDFGTGYSSLAYLKQLPADCLKIDRTFVTGIADDARDAAIVKAAIDLGHDLGFDIVAEGVETAAAWQALTDLGCDQAQGYLIGRPMPVDEVESWLREPAWPR